MNYLFSKETGVLTPVSQESTVEAPSIPLGDIHREMKRLRFVDDAVLTDFGHYSILPKGMTSFSLVESWLSSIARTVFEGQQVLSPAITDWGKSEVQSHSAVFNDDIYHVTLSKNENLALKYSGDVGMFEILSRANLTIQSLPVRIFELSDMYRYVQKGQLSGLRLSRSFRHLDMKILVDVEHAFREYGETIRRVQQFFERAFNLKPVMTVTREFFEGNREQILDILRLTGNEVIVEVVTTPPMYWTMKHTYYTDYGERIIDIQFDPRSAEVFQIRHKVETESRYGVLIHNSLGTVGRWLSTFFYQALTRKPSCLPLWLAPTQVRVIPASLDFLSGSEAFARQLSVDGFRADVDDRDCAVSKKIRRSEEEWLPFTIVFGSREESDPCGILAVRCRGGTMHSLSYVNFVGMMNNELKNMPVGPQMYASKVSLQI